MSQHRLDLLALVVREATVLRNAAAFERTAGRRVNIPPLLLRSVWQHRNNISPYDIPYVALALHHGIPLVTLDVRLAGAAFALGADVVDPGAPDEERD